MKLLFSIKSSSLRTPMLVLFILFCSLSVFGQNQAEVALSWKSGTYNWNHNKSGNSLLWGKPAPLELTLTKGPDGLISTVTFGEDRSYIRDKEGVSNYAGYFQSTSGSRKLIFTSKSIIIFKTQDGEWIDIVATVGKPINSSIAKVRSKVRKAYTQGKLAQESDVAAAASGRNNFSIGDKEIKDLEIKLVPYETDKIGTGRKFTIGTITTLADGSILKSKNLGGVQNSDDYEFLLEGVKDIYEFDPLSQARIYVPFSCGALKHGGILVTVNNSTLNKEVKQELISFDCWKSNSKEAILASKFSNYDEIRFYTANFLVRTQKVKIETLYDFGVEKFGSELMDMNNSGYDHVQIIINNKIGWADKEGNVIVEPQYDEMGIRPFSGEYITVRKGGLYGFIDLEGNEVTPTIYDKVSKFYNGYCKVTRNNKFGLLNAKGEELIPTEYEEVTFFQEGLMRVRKNGKYGFVNKQNIAKIPIIYEVTNGSIREGLVGVKKNGKAGFVDLNNNIVIPLKYSLVYEFSEGLAAAQLNGKWGFIDKTGKLVIEHQYLNVNSFYEGRAYIDNEEAYITGFVDKNGEEEWHKNVPKKPEPRTNVADNNSGGSKKSNGPGDGWVLIQNNGGGGSNRMYIENENGSQSWVGTSSPSKYLCDTNYYLLDLDTKQRIRLIYQKNTGCDSVVEVNP